MADWTAQNARDDSRREAAHRGRRRLLLDRGRTRGSRPVPGKKRHHRHGWVLPS